MTSRGPDNEGVYSHAVWKAEFPHALKSRVGRDATVSNGDFVQRVTVGDREPPSNKVSRRNVVQEENENVSCLSSRSQPGSSPSLRSLDLHDAPVGVNNVGETISTLLLNDNPPSATSTVTLFEFEAGFGPQAASTPLDELKKNHPTSKKAAPHNPLPNTRTRSSSIVYIKSDNDPLANSSTSARWAVRKFIPKGSILQHEPANPGGGLPPLSLLRDHDTDRRMTSPASGKAEADGKSAMTKR